MPAQTCTSSSKPLLAPLTPRPPPVMTGPSDPAAAAEAIRLGKLREKVIHQISGMRPDRITAGSVDSAWQKYRDILGLADQYGVGMISLLKKFPSIEEVFRLQYRSELESLEQTVDDLEDIVCDKIHQIPLAEAIAVQHGVVPQVYVPTSDEEVDVECQADAQHAAQRLVHHDTEMDDTFDNRGKNILSEQPCDHQKLMLTNISPQEDTAPGQTSDCLVPANIGDLTGDFSMDILVLYDWT